MTFTIPLPACLNVERLNGGKPVLAPTDRWWEDGVTYNTSAIYLERSERNASVFINLLGVDALTDSRLAEGIVALHYRARPSVDQGYPWSRSFLGLALYTPELEIIKRFTEPVLLPGEHPNDQDHMGIEDVRITRIGDTFYAVYCGTEHVPPGGDWYTRLCVAFSPDLLHWKKHGFLQGNLDVAKNKDGVLFEDRMGESYVLLHRPMIGHQSTWAIRWATSDAPHGTYTDGGLVLGPETLEDVEYSWVGAGSVPIPLGDSRYLTIFHTGNHLHSGEHVYHLDAALLDCSPIHNGQSEMILESRLNRILVPETDYEILAPKPDSVANAVFTCGTYIYRDHLYILYSGGDTYVMAAKIKMDTLLNQMKK